LLLQKANTFQVGGSHANGDQEKDGDEDGGGGDLMAEEKDNSLHLKGFPI
jgi:hypothetical protein